MKLTTKIVAGIIFSIFILSFCFIILLPHISKEKPQINQPAISQENIISVDVEPYQTIWIDREPTQDNLNAYPIGTVRISNIYYEEEKNKVMLPEELLKFVDIASINDTLFIRMRMNEFNKQYLTEKRIKQYIPIIDGVNFYIHTDRVDVVSKYDGIKIDVRNITTDKIRIHSFGNVDIVSCTVKVIEPPSVSNHKRFMLQNSYVKELNIDLDQIGSSWRIENCDIEVENLTGSNKHNVNLPKSEAKIMNWFPKSKEARLTVTLYGDTARIEFP